MIIAGSHYPLDTLLTNSVAFILAIALFIFYPFFKKTRSEENKLEYLNRVIVYTSIFTLFLFMFKALCASVVELVLPFSFAVSCLISIILKDKKKIITKFISIIWGVFLVVITGDAIINFIEK